MKHRLAILLLPLLAALLFAGGAQANSLAAWGSNYEGQFGAGFKGSLASAPVYGNPVSGISKLVDSYCCGFALLEDGTIADWGANLVAQMADGTREGKPVPTFVHGLPRPAVDVAASGAHALAALDDGSVWAWGGNFWGTLGNGTRNLNEGGLSTLYPLQVEGVSGARAVYAGAGVDAVLLGDGSVLAWGEDRLGQLGDGSQEAKLRPIKLKLPGPVGKVEMGGTGSQGETLFATLQDGRVFALGSNNGGQAAVGSTALAVTTATQVPISGITQVSPSVSHTLVLAGGRVYASGLNSDSELHYATTEHCKRPAQLPCSRSLHDTGLGGDEVSAGWRYSFVRQGGTILAWGINNRGLLGIGSFSADVATPTPVKGIGDAERALAGEYFSYAQLAQAPHTSSLVVTAGSASLTMSWTSAGNGQRWNVTWRPVTRPKSIWSKPAVLIPASSRSYTVTGLTAGQKYEVRLKQLLAAGYQIASGTPF